MINKWKYPTENVMAEYFSLCEQLEKSGKKSNEDLIEEKELQKNLFGYNINRKEVESFEKCKTINDYLHAFHFYIVNNEKIFHTHFSNSFGAFWRYYI